MAALSPFVMKLSFYLPSDKNQQKNIANVNYIATRPGTDRGVIEPERDQEIHSQYLHERPGSHGLFDQDGRADLDLIKDQLKNHDGIVWRGVVSLREDEAVRINHITRQDWEDTLQKSFSDIAEKLHIKESNFRWAAAYHQEAGHPHCHFLFWEENPERDIGRLSDGERRDLKKAFVKNIYAKERERLLIEKTFYRDEIRNGTRDILGLRQQLRSETEVIKEELGNTPGIPPRITPEQEEELNQKLQSLSETLPGYGRIALRYMPEEVKSEVRETADWLLTQPGFAQEVDKYLAAHYQISGIYTTQEQQLSQAREKAYNDLRDRISQDILRGAVQHNQHIHYVQNTEIPLQEVKHKPSNKREKEVENWYRASFRLIERERASVVSGERLGLPEFASYQEGLNKLLELANQIPEDFKGRPVIAYLPHDLKQQARDIADWLLTNPAMKGPLHECQEAMQGDSDMFYNRARDQVAENALYHALRLLDREIPVVQMILHQQRAEIAIKQISRATADIVINNADEAVWTLETVHEALSKMEVATEDIEAIITRWAGDAGIEGSVDDVLQRTYDGDHDISFIGRAKWTRMADNLGYHEHELLVPWMGQMTQNPEEQEKVTKPKQPDKSITPPEFIPENVPAILETYNTVTAKPDLTFNKDELQWTIWTSSWVLKELGVDTDTCLQILSRWVQRSGIEMSQARIADTIHRANLVLAEDVTKRWLGHDNWQKLMRNIGAIDIPDSPWEYPAPALNLAGSAWKGAWQAVQRERTKSEYQARRLQAEHERDQKRREGRDR